MIDYDIIDINEEMDGLSYEEQIEYLNDREDNINGAIEELNALLNLYILEKDCIFFAKQKKKMKN